MSRSAVEKALRRAVEILPPDKTWQMMEVCGTHTMSIARMGIRELLSPRIRLVSGPGCPVCVTSEKDVAASRYLAGLDSVTLTTFGDMMRVPSGGESLLDSRAAGADVRVVYSPTDAVDIAAGNPGREVVFLAVGFETTSPTIAAALLSAQNRNIDNFYILPMMKLVPPALRLLCGHPELAIDGFLLPGHVSVIIGEAPYRFISGEFGIPGVITGFEGEDVASGLLELARLISSGEAEILNSYRRAVPREGNPSALAALERVFEPEDAEWRGIGELPMSGLTPKGEFRRFDARLRFDIPELPVREHPGCRCGEVILGKILPPECPLFGKVCSPRNALGPCMVSSEGACAAYYKYGSGK